MTVTELEANTGKKSKYRPLFTVNQVFSVAGKCSVTEKRMLVELKIKGNVS